MRRWAEQPGSPNRSSGNPSASDNAKATPRSRSGISGGQMAEENSAAPRIAAASLVRFIAAAYRAVGIAAGEAEKAAGLMAASDISGADGHGVFRLPQYIRRIKAGGLNIAPQIRVIRQARGTALVDGDNGLGSL